jgi:hypothetical protein
MSKVVRVTDGNYKIVVDNPADGYGGLITLDTTGGYATDRGKVVVTGDLEVKGTTTTVESTVTTIADNIITLNEGQSGAGISVSLGSQAGIEVDRGSLPKARLVFDETVAYSAGGSSGTGSFIFENEAGQFLPVSFNSVNAQGSLYVNTPGGGISVAGTTDYEENVFTYSAGVITDGGGGVIINEDFIPNAKGMVDYVDFALLTNLQFAIEDGDTRVEAVDRGTSGIESSINVIVDGTTIAHFHDNRFEISKLELVDNEITTTRSNTDLVLSASGTGSVRIQDNLLITETPANDDALLDPDAPLEGVKIYSKTEDEGGTGIFFVNKTNTQDELISRNRALVFSMLF